jgi:hypothetical protein
MFKTVHHTVWAFDCEWVPDPTAARTLHGLPAGTPDDECMEALWKAAGATPEEPEPFVKSVLCRIVSLAAVQRVKVGDAPARVSLTWRPRVAEDFATDCEGEILRRFLDAVGRHRPQLVGYNSHNADLRVMVQRALVHGLCLPEFCKRPDKPWEGVDYFAKGGDFHIDLMDVVAGYGRCPAPSLNELAALCGIPGKTELRDASVASLWLEGRLAEIVERNLWGALATYLLWLRTAHLGGFFDAEAYVEEQELVRELLADLAGQGLDVATRYAEAWDATQAGGSKVGTVAEPGVAFLVGREAF